jgi:hypothetical protein
VNLLAFLSLKLSPLTRGDLPRCTNHATDPINPRDLGGDMSVRVSTWRNDMTTRAHNGTNPVAICVQGTWNMCYRP